MEKIFVRYPNFRSSTRNSDPCNDPIRLFKENLWKKINFKFLLDYLEDNLDELRKLRNIYEVKCEIEEVFKPVKKLLVSYPRGRINKLKYSIPDNLAKAKNIIEQLQSINGVSNVFIKKILHTVEVTGSLSNALIKLLRLEKLSDIEKRYLSDADSLSVFY